MVEWDGGGGGVTVLSRREPACPGQPADAGVWDSSQRIKHRRMWGENEGSPPALSGFEARRGRALVSGRSIHRSHFLEPRGSLCTTKSGFSFFFFAFCLDTITCQICNCRYHRR